MRRLVIAIDAGAATCDGCVRLVSRERRCALFGHYLNPTGPVMRLPQCLAAESAARPWEDADDDPIPDHLRDAKP